jgi:hypothetical protein
VDGWGDVMFKKSAIGVSSFKGEGGRGGTAFAIASQKASGRAEEKKKKRGKPCYAAKA